MAEWVRVAEPEACEGEGCVLRVVANGTDVVLARSGSELFALEDCCSHEDFPLSEGEVENGQIECIHHGARFDLRTGKATALPAVRPVKTFPLEVRDGGVFVQVE